MVCTVDKVKGRMEYCPYCHTLWVAPIGLHIHISKKHHGKTHKGRLGPRINKGRRVPRIFSQEARNRMRVAMLNRSFVSCIQCKEVFVAPSGIMSHVARAHSLFK